MPLTVEILKKYANNIFVETGSRRGGGINVALSVGFKKICSIEVRERPYHNCCRLFRGNEKVILYHGDSSKILWDVIKDINEPITFWLDAHTEEGSGDYNAFPLAKELEVIARHPIKTHTVIIDDINHPAVFGEGYDWVIKAIRKINHHYAFEFYKTKNNLVVASI